MYKKALGSLVLINLLLVTLIFGVSEDKFITAAVEPAFELSMEITLDERSSTVGIVYASASDQRIVDYGMIKRPESEWTVEEVLRLIASGEEVDHLAKYVISGNVISDASEELLEKAENVSLYCKEDFELLLRIVEAEAGGEDEEGKLLVANVVLNRVNNDNFPDTVSEVVLQQSKGVTQFSPVASGRIWKVKISDETILAVSRALCGENISQGALYFAARKYADSSSMRWFDQKLTYLFTHGNHEFFF